jgi:hypothetical protein
LLYALPMVLTTSPEGTVAVSQDAAPSLPETLVPASNREPRALRILAKSMYRELRAGGLREEDVMSIAGELLSLVAGEVKERRRG